MLKTLKSFFLASSLFVLSCAPALALAQTQNVVTRSAEGVLIVRGAEQITAVEGTPVLAGDVLKTPEGGEADISLNGLAGIRVLASSEVALDGTKTEAMRVAIRSGNAILNLDKLPTTSTFSVETPTAVASVRGTQFWGRVGAPAGEAVTTFAVREGTVEILAKSSSKIFTLEKGQALDISASVTPPLIRPALDDEMTAMAQADSIRTSA